MLSLSWKESVTANPPDGRSPFNVLVCEDDQMIAYDLISALELVGINALGPAVTYESAAILADSDVVDAAVVDLNLRDGRTGVALARSLHARGIAVILCSSDALGPCELDDIQHIFVPKPMAAEALCEFIQKIVISRASPLATEKA